MPSPDLAEYRRKRDFARTPEPEGGNVGERRGPLTFMVHKHAATRLHYDLRLELDGVLKSWAVPKGPSADPAEKRFAAATEDHPLSYAPFEGVIPKGEYGAGPSLVWDAGTYSPDEKGQTHWDDREGAEAELRRGLEAGKLSVTFRGRKLKGSWALVRMQGKPNEWLLLKHKDWAVGNADDLTDDGASVASGLTLEDFREGKLPRAHNRSDWAFSPASLAGSKAATLAHIEPMLATAAPIPNTGEFSFEPKLDGIRVLAYLDHGTVELRSRGKRDITHAYPGIAASLSQQPCATAIIDAEIVALSPDGKPSFELLQQRMNLQDGASIARAEATIPTVFFAFDVLHLDGWDLTKAPLTERREVLARILAATGQLAQVVVIPAAQEEAFAASVAAGFEGIIAKRNDSRYEAGKRTMAWLKRKALDRDNFLVAGWTPGTGHRTKSFGGLVIAEATPNGLAYRGRVGGGFTDAEVVALRKELEGLARETSPFDGPTPDDKVARWVEPTLEVSVEYLERTSGGVLRAPIYKGRASSGVAAGHVSHAPARPDVLEQLDGFKQKGIIKGDGWEVAVTNLDKVLWPSQGELPGYTKRDVLRYAATVFPTMEQHIRDRPLTLLRFPDGIHGNRFYQKHWTSGLPDFVEHVTMYSEGEGGDQQFLLCNNLPTLLWMCQLADIEWHATLARIVAGPDGQHLPATFDRSTDRLDRSLLNYPDFILFDLDPYIYAGHEKAGDEPQPNETAFARTAEIALALKELLDSLRLSSFVKTSGATGLHIYVPVLRQLDYSVIRAAANTICVELLARRPKEVTMEWSTDKRAGKVFLDANQNARHKNLAVAYSPRAKPGATVSTPLRWDEVGKRSPSEFTLRTMPERVALGDPWAGIYNAKQDLHALLGL